MQFTKNKIFKCLGVQSWKKSFSECVSVCSFFISCMKSSLFQRLDWHHVFRQTNGDIVPAFAFLSCHLEYNWRDSAIPWWTSSLCFSFVALAAELSSLAFKHSWYRLGCWCLRWWNKLDISRISILLTSCAPCMLSCSVSVHLYPKYSTPMK